MPPLQGGHHRICLGGGRLQITCRIGNHQGVRVLSALTMRSRGGTEVHAILDLHRREERLAPPTNPLPVHPVGGAVEQQTDPFCGSKLGVEERQHLLRRARRGEGGLWHSLHPHGGFAVAERKPLRRSPEAAQEEFARSRFRQPGLVQFLAVGEQSIGLIQRRARLFGLHQPAGPTLRELETRHRPVPFRLLLDGGPQTLVPTQGVVPTSPSVRREMAQPIEASRKRELG